MTAEFGVILHMRMIRTRGEWLLPKNEKRKLTCKYTNRMNDLIFTITNNDILENTIFIHEQLN